MSRSIILSLVLILMLALAVSCSGNGSNVATTPDVRETVSSDVGGTYMMGLWQFTADVNTGEIGWTQLRAADAVINVLGFMEPPPLTLMDLDWPNLVIDGEAGTIDVGVILTHPIAGDDVFMGFDVRGVCFGPRVANADGLTIIPGPEYFTGVPFGYQDGLVGAPNSVGNFTGLAGYKYFCDGLGPDDVLATFMSDEGNLALRGSYGSGNVNQRNYNLVWDDLGDFFIFNYAIYANYDWPVGDPPITIDNFDISTANSAEAFCASVTELSNGLYFADGSGGGSISLDVEIWDWQEDVAEVSLEAPGVIANTPGTMTGPGSTSKSTIWNIADAAGTPTTAGDLDIIITATDTETFGASWFLDLLPASHELFDVPIYNAFVHTATVAECSPPTVESILPAIMATYPGTYTGVSVTGTGFSFNTGVTAIDITDDTDTVLLSATNINTVDDTTVTCDFDFVSDGWEGGSGTFNVVVTTSCSGEGTGILDVADNLLYYGDFSIDDGGMIGFGTGGYTYNSSDGRWEESSPNSNYNSYSCRKLRTPNFDVPASASDVHFDLQHSAYIESSWDACMAGWTNNNGATFYGDLCDGNNWWKPESGYNYNRYYCYAWYYIGSSCVGCNTYFGSSSTPHFWSSTFGSLGTGVQSVRHLTGGENLLGMTNAAWMCVFLSDGSVQYRGHEIYELTVWYDP